MDIGVELECERLSPKRGSQVQESTNKRSDTEIQDQSGQIILCMDGGGVGSVHREVMMVDCAAVHVLVDA